MTHRRHFGQKRDARQEMALHRHGSTNATSFSLAQALIANKTSPSQAVARRELLARVCEAIDGMSETDREILMLRHFEQLENGQVAEILGFTKAAASNRYTRALKRLRDILRSAIPGLGEESTWDQGVGA